jgi:hypothetical protein
MRALICSNFAIRGIATMVPDLHYDGHLYQPWCVSMLAMPHKLPASMRGFGATWSRGIGRTWHDQTNIRCAYVSQTICVRLILCGLLTCDGWCLPRTHAKGEGHNRNTGEGGRVSNLTRGVFTHVPGIQFVTVRASAKFDLGGER